MPQYLYKNQKTGEIREVFQKMTDNHVYKVDGETWNRVFLPVGAVIDSKFDPFSSRDYVTKTAGKKGSIGDLIDKSAELSQKRAEIVGKDKIKEDYQTNWSKRRCGKLHPDLKNEQLKKNLDKKGLNVSFD